MNRSNEMNTSTGHDKRNFIRMRVDSPVELSIAGSGQSCTGICRDLSGGGMLVEVDKVLPEGTQVEVTLLAFHSYIPILRTKGTVTRVSASSKSGTATGLIGLRLEKHGYVKAHSAMQ